MKEFRIFKHPTLGVKVVKVGFSWPALFITFFWTLYHKLWAIAGIWFGCVFVLGFINAIAKSEPINSGGLDFFLLLVFLAVHVIPAVNGNRWREKNLARRGFVYTSTVHAETLDAANAQLAKVAVSASTSPTDAVKPNSQSVQHYAVGATNAPAKTANQPTPVEQPDETLWADALSEFGGDHRKPGLWAKAFATADGDETKAKARYLQLRVAELQAEQQKQKDQSAARLLDQQLRETKAKLEARGHLVTDTTLEMIRQLRTKVQETSDFEDAYQLAVLLEYVVLSSASLFKPSSYEVFEKGNWQISLAKLSSPEEFVKWTIKTLC